MRQTHVPARGPDGTSEEGRTRGPERAGPEVKILVTIYTTDVLGPGLDSTCDFGLTV